MQFCTVTSFSAICPELCNKVASGKETYSKHKFVACSVTQFENGGNVVKFFIMELNKVQIKIIGFLRCWEGGEEGRRRREGREEEGRRREREEGKRRGGEEERRGGGKEEGRWGGSGGEEGRRRGGEKEGRKRGGGENGRRGGGRKGKEDGEIIESTDSMLHVIPTVVANTSCNQTKDKVVYLIVLNMHCQVCYMHTSRIMCSVCVGTATAC